MKLLLPALTLLTAMTIGTSAQAQNYPWCAQYGHGQRHWGVLHRQYAISAAARAAFTAARLSVLSMAALSSTSRRLPWRQCNCAYDKRPRFGPGRARSARL